MSTDPDSPKALANVRTHAQAALLVAHLESIGIKAHVSGMGGSTGWPENVGYVQVVVRQADLQRAKEEFERMEQKASDSRKDQPS